MFNAQQGRHERRETPNGLHSLSGFQGHLFLMENRNDKNEFTLLSLLNPLSYIRRPQRVMTE